MERNWNKLLRPITWDAVVGQSHLVGPFQTMIAGDKFSSFSVFAGPTGIGKSLVAELVGKSITCTSDDKIPCNQCVNCKTANNGTSTNVLKYDAPNMNEEDMGNLIESIFKVDIIGTKVFVIEEAHTMDEKKMQPKWLEHLTRIPDNVHIIFCTTQLYSLIPEMRNRASIFYFEVPTEAECLSMMQNISTRLGFVLPSLDILTHFIKTNRNSPRGIIQTLENFALSDTMSDSEIRAYYRMQDSGVYHRVLCALIEPSVTLYDFIREVSGPEDINIHAIISGLKDYILRILMEISLGTQQGINADDKAQLQALLSTSGDAVLLRITKFLGGLTSAEIAYRDEALFKLITFKLELMNATGKTITQSNLQQASTARMNSLSKTVATAAAEKSNVVPKTGFITSADDVRGALG